MPYDRKRPLGVLAALPQELGDLVAQMQAEGVVETITLGQRDYHLGTAYGVPCVVTLARIGKVAAATTATALIHRFDVCAVVFTGVAGGVAREVAVGDIVVASQLLQHDLDASPIFPRHEVPLLGVTRFAADAVLFAALRAACDRFVAEHGTELNARFRLRGVRVHTGLIVSGDRFVSNASEVEALRDSVPDALAVEMEGAALAQVCYEYGVPCVVVRTVSDTADDHAIASFTNFLAEIAARYSSGILKRFLAALAAGTEPATPAAPSTAAGTRPV